MQLARADGNEILRPVGSMRQLLIVSVIALPLHLIACSGSGQTSCGDRVLDFDETCDDGNWLSGDGCDSECQIECGNGVLDIGEECEDGNRDADDGCDERCRDECGNGVLDGGEECEPSLTPSDCRDDCHWESIEADLALPDPGSSTTIAGELTAASPTWTRPAGTCNSYSSINGDCAWDGYVLVNEQGGTVTLTVEAHASGTGDGTLRDSMLFLYEGDWAPHDPLSCFASDDDSGEGRDAMLEAVELEPDQPYYLVISSFYGLTAEDHLGSYVLELTVR